jgi:outer membrane receptor protein involved in Fe transport
MRTEAEGVKDSITESDFVEFTATPSEPTWQTPVLDASGPIVTPDMLARVPGWTADMVGEYLKQGWTMDQLATYYQEQVAQHTTPEQH